MLIIGCGNRQRGDDAAGILVAERLIAHRIHAETCSGEVAQLMDLWADSDDVIVIDAVVTGAPVGAVRVWDGHRRLDYGTSSGSTHGLGVGEAVELARALDRLPARLRVFGIEGKRFEIASAMSPEVESAVAEVAKQIAHEVNEQR